MEKKKINLGYILIIIIVLILLIAGYKNIKNHHNKEYQVINSKILETAKECYLKGDCKDKITLKTLYDKKLLEIQVDPVTKENVDENMCIEFSNKEAKFCKE